MVPLIKLIKKDTDTGWKDVAMKGSFTTDSDIPMKYRIKNGILYLNGVIRCSDSFPVENSNCFNIPNISLEGPTFIKCEISSNGYTLTSNGGIASLYINATGNCYIRNMKTDVTGTYARIFGSVPLI